MYSVSCIIKWNYVLLTHAYLCTVLQRLAREWRGPDSLKWTSGRALARSVCPRDLTGEFIEGAFYREVWQFKAPGAGILILKEQRVLLQAAQMLKGQREGSVSRAWPKLNPGEGELYLKAPAKQGGGRRNKYPQLSLLPPSSLLSWPPIAQT